MSAYSYAPVSYTHLDVYKRQVEALRKELYEAAGRNRDYYVKAEDMQNLLPDWEEANGCIATSRITVEGLSLIHI